MGAVFLMIGIGLFWLWCEVGVAIALVLPSVQRLPWYSGHGRRNRRRASVDCTCAVTPVAVCVRVYVSGGGADVIVHGAIRNAACIR